VTEINIRRATRSDLAAIIAFNASLAKETEDLRLELDTLTQGVEAVFDDSDLGFYLIAESDGVPVGGLLITEEWSDWRNAPYWWIQSVYVRPEYRNRRIYSVLHRYVEEIAKGKKVPSIRLYVDRNNEVAKSVYKKLGMTSSRYDFFEKDL
jgi:ribosomal protein S18 acetylase RimI-like enzyme